MSSAYADYRIFIDYYLSGSISVDEFQAGYIKRFKSEVRRLDEPLFGLLDGLFGDVDAFTTDPLLLKEDPNFYLDETGLRERVKRVADKMDALEK